MDPDSPAHQLVGAVFSGRWKLQKLLGEGGMGAVYEAHGMHGEGVRALKVLHAEFVGEEQILTRFLAEAQAVRTLQHPGIVQIFDCGRAEDGTPYLVMELLEGGPLSSFMAKGRPMPQPHAAGIMIGVLGALQLAHSRGVVHRDLKPDNLYMVSDGRGGHNVKVLDFGIAKVMDAAGGMGSKTKTGVLMGTPGYMSPEQIKNSKGVDPRSDLWSIGIILYEMLTGAEAFPADNEFTRLTMVLTQEVRPIAEVAPQLAAWAPFFQRALSKELSTRFQTANEMAQALSAMMTQKPPSSHQPARPQAPQGHGTLALNLASPEMHQPYGAPAASGPQTLGSPAVGSPGQHAAPQPQQGYQAPQRPSAPPVYVSVGSVPPPASLAGPSTHQSPQRPGATLQTGFGGPSPAVELLAPPAVGVPWWVVGAVGAATFVLGFLAGFFAH